MPRCRFSIDVDVRSIVLAPQGIKWKKNVFHGDGLSLISFLVWKTENENETILFASSNRFGTCTFWPWKVNFKICTRFRSVRSRPDDPRRSVYWPSGSWSGQFGMHIPRSGSTSQVVWHCASLSPSCRDLLTKNGLWPHFDRIWPPVTSPWSPIVSWTEIITAGVSGRDPEIIGWFRSVYAKREPFSYSPQRRVMGRWLNWPDLRSSGYNFWDIQAL